MYFDVKPEWKDGSSMQIDGLLTLTESDGYLWSHLSGTPTVFRVSDDG